MNPQARHGRGRFEQRQKRTFATRLYLLTSLALFGVGAMAADNWRAFSYDQSAYDYPSDKLREAWPRLTRGFSDYPYPDANWVVNMAAAHPNALERTVKAGTGFTDKPEEAAQYAVRLQDVWRLLFHGDYAKAKGQGLALGVGGQIPTMFAQVLYAMFLAPDQAEKQRLLEEVIGYTEQAGPLVKADIVAQFGSVYAKARLAEELSVPVVLKRGYTSEIPKELDALLVRQPSQPFALTLYGGYEAGVIRKIGKLVDKVTYGVSADKMEQCFARFLRQINGLPIGHYEYANALACVYGDDKREKAITQLKQAVAIKPINTTEALEVAHVKKLLAGFEQNTAQR